MNTVADIHSMTGLAHGNARYKEASAPSSPASHSTNSHSSSIYLALAPEDHACCAAYAQPNRHKQLPNFSTQTVKSA